MTDLNVQSWHSAGPLDSTEIIVTEQPVPRVRQWIPTSGGARPPTMQPIAWSFEQLARVSLGLAAQKIATIDVHFPEGISPEGKTSEEDHPSWNACLDNSSMTPINTKRSRTRIKPPDELIRLEDRLQYLLQPPLEHLLGSRSLGMPFQPFDYQYTGIAFLYPRYSGILADEMGLGKTMQAITAIRLLLHQREIRSVLLICPKPLVTNWQREFAMWAPELPITAISGNQQRRKWQWRQTESPIKIANYELLLRDRDLFTKPADGSGDTRAHFDLVVLDEAQRIKNRSGSTSQIVCSIPRKRAWALTGTPIENSTDDLLGIFEFLSPGYLKSDLKPRAIGRAVADHVLRRTKDKVLTDLPPKLSRDAELDLTPPQIERYTAAEEEGVVHLSELGRGVSIQHVFELVLRLKQICNFDPVTKSSAKLERLTADLEEIAESGQKAIVFSQWVGTLDFLKQRLGRFGPLEYHGKVPMRKRDAVLRQFKEDPSKHVLLMSYGAGAVGLNLQFCQYVFLFDRWWNPAVEDQAINRAHRIGVSGPVTVTRFLMLSTIEERIEQILREKRELFETIFSDDKMASDTPSGASRTGMTQKEIFGLFQLDVPNSDAAPKSDEHRAA